MVKSLVWRIKGIKILQWAVVIWLVVMDFVSSFCILGRCLGHFSLVLFWIGAVNIKVVLKSEENQHPKQNIRVIWIGFTSVASWLPILLSSSYENTSKMSLKPKRVDFDTTWASLKETVKGVITFSNVARATWNDRFTGMF